VENFDAPQITKSLHRINDAVVIHALACALYLDAVTDAKNFPVGVRWRCHNDLLLMAGF
jgi:hypothetical protein